MHDAYFYPASERPEQIKALINFLHEEQSLLLVLGDHGTGKSSLLNQFQYLGKAPAHTLRIKGKPNCQPNKLVSQICKAWQLTLKNPKAYNREQLDEMLDGLKQYHHSGLLIVDDAHQLPLATLAALVHLSLAQSTYHIRLRIVLLGLPDLFEHVQCLHRPNAAIPNITLTPLSLKETQSFAEHILDKLGIGKAVTLTDGMAHTLFQETNGIPAAIYQRVNTLAKGTKGVHTPHAIRTLSFDSVWQTHWIKIASFSMLLFSLLGIYQYNQQTKQLTQLASNATPALIKKGYTIQLMAAKEPATLEHFAKAHHIEQFANIETKERHHHPWYALTYGDFDSATVAQSVMATLPKDLTIHKPWVTPHASPSQTTA